MFCVCAARKQKIGATVKLQAYVEAARNASQLQEKQEAENRRSQAGGVGKSDLPERD
jgi:hypothetical protein